MTSFINSTWVWSNFHFLKDSTLVTFRGHQTLSIFLRTQFVTTFRWYNCNYNSVVHNGHDNGIIKKIEIKMWISKMLSLEFLYLDSTTNTHKNWTKKNNWKKSFGWMNLHLKCLENVARHMFTEDHRRNLVLNAWHLLLSKVGGKSRFMCVWPS